MFPRIDAPVSQVFIIFNSRRHRDVLCKPWLIAFILALVVSGVYSVHQSMFEVGLVLGVGVLGYFLRYCKVPILPMVLGVVLGFMIESNYRRSLLLTGGDHSIFITDKVSLGLLLLAAVLTAYSLWREFAKPAAVKAA